MLDSRDLEILNVQTWLERIRSRLPNNATFLCNSGNEASDANNSMTYSGKIQTGWTTNTGFVINPGARVFPRPNDYVNIVKNYEQKNPLTEQKRSPLRTKLPWLNRIQNKEKEQI